MFSIELNFFKIEIFQLLEKAKLNFLRLDLKSGFKGFEKLFSKFQSSLKIEKVLMH